MPKCRDCNLEKEQHSFVKNKAFSSGYDTLCLECNRKRIRAWRKANPEKRQEQQKRESRKPYNLNKELKYRYGISLETYNTMFSEQQGCCAICGTHQEHLPKRLAVDHCHASGTIRKLLCSPCNLVLGNAKDNPAILQKAITYLTGY